MEPRLSIVIPVRHAPRTIRSTIESALAQCHSYPAEVIAVVSSQDPSAALLAGFEDPALRVMVVEGKQGVPQLRRNGVLASSAPLIAIAEDHCLFPAGWAEGLARNIEERHVDVSGGPVGNGRLSIPGWAQYYSRYTAFLPPGVEAPVATLPGNNACYRREILDRHGRCIVDGFWEAEFNDTIRHAGYRFWISPSLVVKQRQHRGALEYVPLRYRHGRCYGARRMATATFAQRRRLLARAPLIAAVLFFRALRNVARKPGHRLRFLAVSPLVLAYVCAWAAGEIAGYLTGAGGSCLETD